LDDLVAAVFGGVINLTVNALQGNIHSFWDGLAAFGAGSAAGTLALYGPAGWAAGSAITGSTNAWLDGAKGWDIVKKGAMGAITGLAGGVGGAWASYASQALGAIPGAIAGGLAGAVAGGFTGGFAAGINNVLFGGGSFEDGFWAGFKSGAISGAIGGSISGGIKGYQLAKAKDANPWTGYKVTNQRSYYSSGYGNPSVYKQPNPYRDCAAYNRGFSDNTNPNDYMQYLDADGGADMYKFLKATGLKRGLTAEWASDVDWDKLGLHMNNGAKVFNTYEMHHYTVVALTVADKANIFFGGTHVVLIEARVFDSLYGTIYTVKRLSGRIVWGYK
jgi:hypothetical protein